MEPRISEPRRARSDVGGWRCSVSQWIAAAAGAAAVFAAQTPSQAQPAQLPRVSSATGDLFGYSLATDADTMIVGSRGADSGGGAHYGVAVVYRWTGTAWTYEATLVPQSDPDFRGFGHAVAVSGNTAVIGADSTTVGGNLGQGASYVFVRSGSIWTQQAKLTAPDGVADDYFGHSVGVSGDTVVIGSYASDVSGNTNQGAAYVFARVGSVWTLQAKLIASDGAARDYFGTSVALSGDTAVVSAPDHDKGLNNGNEGAVYVFTRSGIVWSQQTELSASDGQMGDKLGTALAISGDTLVAGAAEAYIGTNVEQGAAYVFTRSGTDWSQQAKLIAADGAAGDAFGIAVAVSGDTAEIGAYWDDIGANTEQGSAYLYRRSGSAWTQQGKLTAPDGATNDYFGVSVAVTTHGAAVGAWGDDVGTAGNTGSVWVFPPAVCAADFNGSGAVTLQDLFDFLAAWFGLDPRADVNASGAVSLQDIFDFLTAWFTGCP